MPCVYSSGKLQRARRQTIARRATITRWAIKGRYLRKTWAGIKTMSAYAFFIVIITAVYHRFPDSYGERSIYQQAADDSLEPKEVTKLLQRGADINYAGKNGETALAIALDWGSDDLVIALVRADADLSATYDEETPLEYAISRDLDSRIIEAMLKKGATLAFSIEGMSPLEYVNEYGDAETAKLLRRYSRGSR